MSSWTRPPLLGLSFPSLIYAVGLTEPDWELLDGKPQGRLKTMSRRTKLSFLVAIMFLYFRTQAGWLLSF